MVSDESAAKRFGAEVRRRRQAAGLTLENLAERSELTPNYLSTIETGKRDASLSTLHSIARGLKVHVAVLLGGTGPGADVGAEALQGAVLLEHLEPTVRAGFLQLLTALGAADASAERGPSRKPRRSHPRDPG